MSTEVSSQRRLGTILFYGIVAILAYLAFLVFQPFLPALAWAVVIVVVSYPWYERVRRFSPTVASIICTLGVTLLLIVPMILVAGAFVRQGVQAVQTVQAQVASGHFEWVNRLWMQIESKFPDANQASLGTILGRYTDQGATFVATKLGTVLRNTASFLFHLSVTMLAMFYLYRDGEGFMERVRTLLPFETEHRDRMIKESHDLIFATVLSSAVAAAAHGILGGLAFGVAGITAPIFWGVMMGFFSLIPLVGSALIWLPASISLISEGHIGAGIGLAIFCSVVVGLVDNVVRPWVISGRAEMGGLVVFISVLGGIAVFGLLGVIVGPIIVATGASLLDLYVPEKRDGSHSGEAATDQKRVVLE